MIIHVIPDKSTSPSMPRGHYRNRKAIVRVCRRVAFMCWWQPSPGLQGICAGVIAQVSSPVRKIRPLDVSNVLTYCSVYPCVHIRRPWGFFHKYIRVMTPEYNNCGFPWHPIVPRRVPSRHTLIVTWLLGNPKGMTHKKNPKTISLEPSRRLPGWARLRRVCPAAETLSDPWEHGSSTTLICLIWEETEIGELD